MPSTRLYTNCPTCGGTCSYLSENWKAVNVVSHLERIELRSELEFLTQQLLKIFLLLDSKYQLKDLSSEDLWLLYCRRALREIPILFDQDFSAPNIHNEIYKATMNIIDEYLSRPISLEGTYGALKRDVK